MEKLIFEDYSKYSINYFINKYTIGELKYIWTFIKGVLNNKYCEMGIICNGKEVDTKEYSRKLCLFDIEETSENLILKNNSIVVFSEAESFWGISNYNLVFCNGSALWIPQIYFKPIYLGNIISFNIGDISFNFNKKGLLEIKNEIYKNFEYKKINFLENLFK